MKKILTKSVAFLATTALVVPMVFAQSSHNTSITASEDITKPYSDAVATNMNTWMIIHCQAVSDGFVWEEPISVFVNKETCKNVMWFAIDRVLSTVSHINPLPVQTFVTIAKETLSSVSDANKNRFDNVEKVLQKMKIFETLNSSSAKTYDEYLETLRKIHREFQNSDFLTEQSKDAFGSALTASLLGITGKDMMAVQKLSEQEKFFFVTEFITKVKDLSETDVAYLRFGNNNELYASADLVLSASTQDNHQEKAYFYAKNMKNESIAESDLNISLQNAPEWVKTDGHALIFEKYPSFTYNTRHTFQVVMTPKKGGKTFTQEVTVTMVNDVRFGIQSFWEYQKNLQK